MSKIHAYQIQLPGVKPLRVKTGKIADIDGVGRLFYFININRVTERDAQFVALPDGVLSDALVLSDGLALFILERPRNHHFFSDAVF